MFIQTKDPLYILFEADENQCKETLTNETGNFEVFHFNIENLSKEFEEYISTVSFKSISDKNVIDNIPTEVKSIEWIREEYIKAFEGFKNHPVGLDKSGKVLEFNLISEYSELILIEKNGGKYSKVNVVQIHVVN